MNPVLPPREHISRVGVEHAATPGMALPGGGFPLFEPVAYCSLRHVHALCHFCLRQALRAKGRHLAIAIITTGLACLMGFFNLRRSPLLPGDGGRQGANDLLRQGQRALLLANFCTAVSQDDLKRFGQVANQMKTIDYLLCLRSGEGRCFSKGLPAVTTDHFDIGMVLQPLLDGGTLTIRKDLDDLSALKVFLLVLVKILHFPFIRAYKRSCYASVLNSQRPRDRSRDDICLLVTFQVHVLLVSR